MFNSLSNINETYDKSDLCSINSVKSFSDSFFLCSPLNLDESKYQEIYQSESDSENGKNESIPEPLNKKNPHEDNLTIEIPRDLFYPVYNTSQRERKEIFKVESYTRPRGRKRLENKKNSLTKHDKYSIDNIIRKIQVHFINFSINYINRILLLLGKDVKLYKISSSSKQNENKKKFLLLKSMTIKEVLSQDISPKYKKQKNKKINIELIDNIKNEPIIKNLLSANFLTVFRELYYNEKGNKLDFLKKIEIYEDLVNKNQKDTLYVKKLNECLKKYFLS